MGPSRNSGAGRAVFPSGISQEESFLIPIWPLEAACILGLMVPSCIKSSYVDLSCFHVAYSDPQYFLPLSFFFFPPLSYLRIPVSILYEWKSLSCVHLLCHPMDYTGQGILQARILEWVAFPFSRGSFQSRDQTQVAHIAGRFLTSWATREA